MNKIVIFSALYFTMFNLSAQDRALDTVTGKNKLVYNTWSIEANIGSNKAVRPFTEGYETSGDDKFLNITGINHFDIGVRKMLNTKFGLKFDFAYDLIENQETSKSLPFQSVQNRIALQGIINLTRVLNFKVFSGRLGLLAHGGVHVSKFIAKPNGGQQFPNGGRSFTENNGGYMLGLTPQFRISDKLVFTTDFTVLSNTRQHLTWDGNSSADKENLSGEMNVISFGLTFYMGDKKRKHADWFISEVPKQDPKVQKKLAELELLKKDGDGDGVTDSLDLQKDTPKNAAVDSRGRFFDTNKNNIPDELEPKIEAPVKETVVTTTATQINTSTDYNSKEILLEFGVVDIYYDVDKTLPVVRSMTVLTNLIKFLKKYPNAKINLTGYADVTGITESNIVLANNRAENLKKYIASNGIDPERMNTSGKGVDESSKVNDDPSLQIARRVSITLQ